ncbi:Enoyl-CoA hydratase/isomerase [Mycolicibacterium rhodesiae JS60]|nr:Enoyl-CoA hydratase/isomerase [Mycolicibacterium rhodesiae JS60]
MTADPATRAEPGAQVVTNVHGAILIVTINRPQVRNAVNLEVAQAIEHAVTELDSRDDLQVGIITGAGGTFCAGMDLKAFVQGVRPSTQRGGFAGIVENPPLKPMIAAVEGYALAGGFEITLACDFVVASSSAVFGLPEPKRGLVAAAGGLLRLPRLIPHRVALEFAMTGEPMTAQRAFDLGLVNRLTEPGQALTEAIDFAGRLSANGPLALRATKRIMTEARDWSLADQFDRQRELTEPVFGSSDAHEGAVAFAEKRAPLWTGS